ncbi:MAG: polymer-forming cytoskeletal protein [Chitinophagales bacterium]|nr:polymer-forming cytoskeletal protein [Chitinophagales bacterium]
MQVINNIGSGTTIEGDIKTEGDLRIDGKIIGNILAKGRLVTGPSSSITGDIVCTNGNIDGMVKGNIQVNETLKVTKTANIDGNITSKKLIVDEGAVIQAKITMSGSQNLTINKPIMNPQQQSFNQNK